MQGLEPRSLAMATMLGPQAVVVSEGKTILSQIFHRKNVLLFIILSLGWDHKSGLVPLSRN